MTRVAQEHPGRSTSRRTNVAPEPRPRAEVRQAVQELLLGSKSFTRLPQPLRQQIAHDTAQVAEYLAAPEGVLATKLPSAAAYGPSARGLAGAMDAPAGDTYERDSAKVNEIGGSRFQAGAAREGAAVAGALLKAVNFPTFVASLIQGVFHAIVEASIEQMEAYGKLVASVAQSLNQFRDENVTDNQGRDHLVEQFPDLFQVGVSGMGPESTPRVQLRDGVDEDKALARVNQRLPIEGGPLKSLDLEDDETEQKLTQAARTQLATSRQQLLATMVLMGINRIVVTDGKISAKIVYDFQARDSRKLQRSAAAYDFARNQYGDLQKTSASEGEYDSKSEGGEYSRTSDGDVDRRDGNYYAKGKYKYTEQPVMTAMSAASETTDAALQTRANLAGAVDINFKSDYFPLEKMADSFQIAQIQNASKPNGPVGPGPAPGGQGGHGVTPAESATPAPASTPPR